MNILPSALSPSVAPVDARGSGTGGDDSRHLHWRAELERAQWQARQRYEPAARAASGGAPRETPEAARATASAAAAQASTVRAPSAASTFASPAPPSAGAFGTCTPDRPMGAAAAEGIEPWAAASATTIATRAALNSRSIEVRPVPGALPFELPDWPDRATQACLQGKRLSVVLRDAALDAREDGPRLRDRLRARCEAGGLELAELLINGTPVEPVAPIK